MAPQVSVVVPTYNRAELLHRTLDSLAAQRIPPGFLEVVVADDGSSDETAELVRRYAGPMPVRYYRQEDRGFRAASARNGGARLASAPVLVFLDAGVVVGGDFVTAHHAVRQAAGSASPGPVVIGLVYGYIPSEDPYPGLAEMLLRDGPEPVVARLRDQPGFRDLRYVELVDVDFALDRLALPWLYCFSGNLSVAADDFWAVGGFDEEFVGYGCEDTELGYRLAEHGARFVFAEQAWAVEVPHDRDDEAVLLPQRRNLQRLLHKHPVVPMELISATSLYGRPSLLEESYREVREWTEQARGMDVRDELAAAAAATPAGAAVAALGCGGAVPETWPVDGALVDFDRELLARAGRVRPAAPRAHAVGIHTPFPDGRFALVVVSSRLAGLWPGWGDAVLAEAHRIGREVRVPLLRQGG